MRKDYPCRCCNDPACTPTETTITLDAGKRVVKAMVGKNNTYNILFPAVLNHAGEGVPAKVACRWGCDKDGNDPSVEVVVSRIIDNAEDRPWKTLMWDANVQTDPTSINPFGSTGWPKSFLYEIELKKDGQSVSRVMVPTLPSSFSLMRAFSHWSFYCRVAHKRIENKSLVSVFVGVEMETANATFDSGYAGQGKPHLNTPAGATLAEVQSTNVFRQQLNNDDDFLPQGVRHIFDILEVDERGEYTSVESDVALFSDWNQQYPNRPNYGFYYGTRPAHCSLIQSSVHEEVENAMPTGAGVPECDSLNRDQEAVDDDYPYIQVNQCEYRTRRGHVTHCEDGKSFTKLRLTFDDGWPDEQFILEKVGDDGTELCDGTFWWAGDRPLGENGNPARIEIAASVMTAPGFPCVDPAGGHVFGNWQTLVGLALRFDGTRYWNRCNFVGNPNRWGNYFDTLGRDRREAFGFLRGEPVTIKYTEAIGFAPNRWVRVGDEIAGSSNRRYTRELAPFMNVTLQLL